jgi:hypothetical protein
MSIGLHWDPQNVIFFGRSIGTGPAIKLASELEVTEREGTKE